jgi:hypothetical protein
VGTKLYRMIDGGLVPVERGRLAAESQVEGWIANKPELLGLDLLIIGRQVVTPHDGRIDLLGIDAEGSLAILELKRDRTPRDVIGQMLDYASWIATLPTKAVHEIARDYLGRSLDLAFQDRFQTTLPETLNENHTMVIIASAFDASSQRIVRYLSERHDIAINTAFFTVFEDNGQILLTTDWLLDQSEVAGRLEARTQQVLTSSDLLAVASQNNITALVEACRTLRAQAEEKPAPAYGGSFRYWLRGRMILGVNVVGARRRPPLGELDVWIPVAKLAEVVAIPGEEIRSALKRDFAVADGGTTDCIVRLKSAQEAEDLIALLRRWIATCPTTDTSDETASQT